LNYEFHSIGSSLPGMPTAVNRRGSIVWL